MEQYQCSCCKSHQGTSGGYSEVIRSFERKPGNLIPALHAVQAAAGYLSEEAMLEVAEWLNVPVSDVYGTATFYTLFATKPKGKYIVRLCDSPPCHIEGSNTIMAAITEELGIKPGETTEDGNFTFEIVSCLGLCGVAPAIMVNEDVYGNLSPEMIGDIFLKYRKKES
ncbi:MAG TPA: NADH-quinone oxidoreductase subunit NuoE [Armatimonadota bacterium]|nr:NADH-quinone oxidoreductase subunit NuoE [Armatimonadota bacterium]